MYAHWTCPHCGTVNTISSASTQLRVAWCDVDAGGCERPVVLDCVVTARVEAFKIEGFRTEGDANV